MKRRTTGLMMILLSVILISCQQTPEQEIIQEKNSAQLESLIAETNDGTEDNPVARDSLRQTYQDQFAGAEDSVNIHVDAVVSYPSGNMPVIRVKPHEFTVDEAKLWAEVLFEGNTAYEPKIGPTKSELQKLILEQKRVLGDEEGLYSYYQGNEAEIEYEKNRIQKQLTFYEEQYSSAPDRYEKKETDWTFRPIMYYEYASELLGNSQDFLNYNQTECLVVESEVDGAQAKLTVTNRNEDDYHLHSIFYENNTEYSTQPLEMTKEDAMELMEKTLQRLGEEKWKVYSCESREGTDEQGQKVYWYSIECIPMYEGMEVLRQNQLSAINADDSYGARYYYETIIATISNGRIVFLEYTSPLDVVAVENSDVAILDFEEVKEIFKKQMQLEYTLGKTARLEPSDSYYEEALAEYTGAEILIQDIRLGLVRIQVSHTADEFRLVPAWCFWGEEGLNWDNTGISWLSEDEFTPKAYYWRLYQAINAIDGSMINVALGY